MKWRWSEIKGFLPDDYVAPTIDPLQVDDSWIGARSLENMSIHDKKWESEYRELCRRLGPLSRANRSGFKRSRDWSTNKLQDAESEQVVERILTIEEFDAWLVGRV